MKQHTPGPWFVDTTNPDAPFGICQDVENGWGIAEVKTFAPEGSDTANARLIATAPEQHDLLIEAVDLVPRINDKDPMAPVLADWCRKARAAIKKATF